MKKQRAYFDTKFFKFLMELADNNNREWFMENKSRYEIEVRNPMLEFIGDFGPRLRKISAHYVADPKPVGGSMFRIYRDARFSRDKTPYKTHAAAQFRHELGRDVHAPGFYLHLEPGAVFAGAGMWRPEPESLAKIRDAIVDSPDEWRRIKSGRKLKAECEWSGESLVRPPRGYDPDHPFIKDLKMKDFIVGRDFTRKDACSSHFMDDFESFCKAAAPLMRFLTEALELTW